MSETTTPTNGTAPDTAPAQKKGGGVAARRTKAQAEIPGTERDGIPDLEAAAEKYRKLRDERSALQRKEEEAKGELLALVRKYEGSKKLQINEDALLHGVIPVHRYEDDEGKPRIIRHGFSETVKVNVDPAGGE